MTDVATAPETTTEAPAPKVDKTRACTCSQFSIGTEWEAEGDKKRTTETTGCTSTTQREFAQGHDARLVSFLVRGQLDGLVIWQDINGVEHTHVDISSALQGISAALQTKGEKAIENATAKRAESKRKVDERNAAREAKAAAKLAAKVAKAQAKQEAAAAKAEAPREVGATVAPGSQEGDALRAGFTKIKVGRWEYEATIDEAGNATYLDGDGVEQTREAGSFRTLENA